MALFYGDNVIANSFCTDLVPLDTLTQKTLDAKDLKSANIQYLPLIDGFKSLAVRIKLIRNAQETIDISTFILKNDVSGKLILKELKDALDRGVHIRLLADGIGTMSLRTLIGKDELRPLVEYAEKSEVKGTLEVRYAQSLLNFKNIIFKSLKRVFEQGLIFDAKQNLHLPFNQRIHDKIFLIDAEGKSPYLIVGGRNIADEYFNIIGANKIQYSDLDILIRPNKNTSGVENGYTKNYKEYFEMLMYDTPSRVLTAKILDVLPNVFFKTDFQKILEMNIEAAVPEASKMIEEFRVNDFFNSRFIDSHGTFVSQFSNLIRNKNALEGRWYKKNSDQRDKSIVHGLKKKIGEAKKLIEIVTPYPIFRKKDIKKIEKLLMEKKDLEIHLYTNSRINADAPVIQIFFEKVILPKLQKLNNKPEIDGRIKIYTFHGNVGRGRRLTNHTKFVRIDSLETLVSSSNLDIRSNRINSESGIFLKDQKTNIDFSNNLKFFRDHSTEVSHRLNKGYTHLTDTLKSKVYTLVEKVFDHLGLTYQF